MIHSGFLWNLLGDFEMIVDNGGDVFMLCLIVMFSVKSFCARIYLKPEGRFGSYSLSRHNILVNSKYTSKRSIAFAYVKNNNSFQVRIWSTYWYKVKYLFGIWGSYFESVFIRNHFCGSWPWHLIDDKSIPDRVMTHTLSSASHYRDHYLTNSMTPLAHLLFMSTSMLSNGKNYVDLHLILHILPHCDYFKLV